MPRDTSDDDGDRGGGGALSLMATTETKNCKLFHTFPSNVVVDVGQVAGLSRASPRREVARAHRRLQGLVHDAHDPLDRPMRAPGAPSGRYLCLPTVTADCAGAATSAEAARERRWRRSGGWRGSVRTPERLVGAIDEPGSTRPIDTSCTSWRRRRGWGRPWRDPNWLTCGGVVRVSCTRAKM